MSDVQFWSIIITAIGTLGGQQIVNHLLGRGKIRGDDATALRKELRDENKELREEIRRQEQRIDELEARIRALHMLRFDMYQVLHDSDVSKDVIAKLRILEAGR